MFCVGVRKTPPIYMGEILCRVRKTPPIYMGEILRRVRKTPPIYMGEILHRGMQNSSQEKFCVGYAKLLLYIWEKFCVPLRKTVPIQRHTFQRRVRNLNTASPIYMGNILRRGTQKFSYIYGSNTLISVNLYITHTDPSFQAERLDLEGRV